MSRTLIATVVVLLAAGAVHAQPLRTGAIRTETKTVELPGAGRVEYTLGFLAVPENRGDPASRLIEIAFLRLPGAPGSSGPPLVYLAGGPGDAGISEAPDVLADWLPARANGDVILVDQRGTGRSRPNLSYRWTGPVPVNLFRSEADGRAILREVAESAAVFFRRQRVDLRGYTTVESADDIEALRVALGAEQVNLMGFSYGTHLALSVIRRHGSRVANAVLIGTEGTAHTWKLPLTMDTQWRKLSALAAADPEISRLVPDLEVLLRRVLARLDRQPMTVTVPNPRGGPMLEIPIGGDALRHFIRRDIGDASDLPVFPRLLYTIDQGDPTMLQWFARRRFGAGSHAMSAMMDVASGVSPNRLAQIQAEVAVSMFRGAANFPYPDDAAGMPVLDLGEEFRAAVVSPVRTLFLSGTLDFNTPPFQAEEVRWGFPNSFHIIVRNAGHEQVLTHPEVGRAIARFLGGEDVGGVTAGWPPLRFVPLVGYDPERTHPSVPRP